MDMNTNKTQNTFRNNTITHNTSTYTIGNLRLFRSTCKCVGGFSYCQSRMHKKCSSRRTIIDAFTLLSTNITIGVKYALFSSTC